MNWPFWIKVILFSSFSLDSNMRTPAWIFKHGVSGCAPASCCHWCCARQLKLDETTVSGLIFHCIDFSYNESFCQFGCSSCSLFSPHLSVCRFPNLWWESHFSKPRPRPSFFAARSNSSLKFSCWQIKVSFRSQPKYEKQDSSKAQVRRSTELYRLPQIPFSIKLQKSFKRTEISHKQF